MSEAATPEVRLSLLVFLKKHLQTDEQRCRLKTQIWDEFCVFLLYVSNVALKNSAFTVISVCCMIFCHYFCN